MRRTPLIPVAIAAASLLATAFPAHAAEPEVIAEGLFSPLSVAVADDGTVYVSQNFASLISKVGETDPIFADEGEREIGAFSVDGDVLTFAATGGPAATNLYTYEWVGDGYEQTEIADLGAYEKSKNPDHGVTYGIAGLSKKCTKQTAKAWRPYKGKRDAHPYATTTADGVTYVADAGANAVLAVSEGDVSTVAVLPATNIKITKTVRKILETPTCTQGKTFRAESVPTDVEVGPDGALYVSSLPGGPEDPRMGANGSVFRIDPQTGKASRLVKGLVSPTGIAIGPDNSLYVAMLFADQVLQVSMTGERSTFAEVTAPGAVDYANGALYVTATGFGPTGPTPTGQVLKYELGVG